MEDVIRTKDLTKIYSLGRRRILAVDKLNLKVGRGEIFGLLGPNGAGKTTTIHMLLGLTPPTSGEGYVLDFDIKRRSREIRKIAGLVPERAGFYWDLTAMQNLKYFASLSDIPRDVALDRINWALDFVGLSKWKNVPVKGFSRGMVQRLALAQVLIKQPKVIFLDEPTAGLDPRGSMMYRRLVKRLNKEYNVTILLSSHLLPEVRKVCHKVGFMRNGRIVRVGKIDELLRNVKFKIVVELDKLDKEIVEEVEDISGVEVVKVKGNRFYLTADNDVRLEISKIVFKHGRLIKTLRVLRPTLEEIFFSIMGGGVE